MSLLRQRFSDSVYQAGVVCIAISLLFFCIPILTGEEEHNFGFFLMNFAATLFYAFYRLAEKKNVQPENKIHHIFLLLILSLVSAFALNREMTVFEDSVTWFSGLLVLLCTNFALTAYNDRFPHWFSHFLSFVNGIAALTFFYLAAYLLPLFLVSLLGSPLLGVSLHGLVPLAFLIYTFILQARMASRNVRYWFSFTGGVFAAMSVVIVFLIQWDTATLKINESLAQSKNKTGLPAWVAAAQCVSSSPMDQKVVRAGLVYSIPGSSDAFSFWRLPGMNWQEEKKHDPLVMIAAFFVGSSKLDDPTRIKILESTFDKHHEAERRLWSGESLRTDSVETEVKLWPRCNLSYTEQTITVNNTSNRSWRIQEEAIYTFYLPEGSVVTSLSLWVNGKEEKGILTSKGLADSAYTRIVGGERRDPSVVHWKEGNTVSVRVFPVLSGQSRKFKIGITSPMERIDGSLRYRDIFFKGPDAADAKENLQVDFEQPANDLQLPASFVSKAKQTYSRKGRYSPGWSLVINDAGLSGCSFSFDGNTYTLSPYHKMLEPAAFSKIYLDINQAWTKEEFDKIIAISANKTVYAYDNGIVEIGPDNSKKLWEKLSRQPFSLFPVYEISDAEHSLLITKSAPSALRLDDLEGSEFLKRAREFLSAQNKINVFNMGDELSVYLRSLKEFRVFRYDNGTVDMLADDLRRQQFPADIENDNRVVIHATDMVVEKTPVTRDISGPDHVMRLFAYNHIMQKLGRGLWLDRPVEDSLVREARIAYVVTPVSSLVVLETQADYDRFGIHDDGASLKNASMNSKGAVPEPHEWALIFLVAGLLLYLLRKRKMQYAGR